MALGLGLGLDVLALQARVARAVTALLARWPTALLHPRHRSGKWKATLPAARLCGQGTAVHQHLDSARALPLAARAAEATLRLVQAALGLTLPSLPLQRQRPRFPLAMAMEAAAAAATKAARTAAATSSSTGTGTEAALARQTAAVPLLPSQLLRPEECRLRAQAAVSCACHLPRPCASAAGAVQAP